MYTKSSNLYFRFILLRPCLVWLMNAKRFENSCFHLFIKKMPKFDIQHLIIGETRAWRWHNFNRQNHRSGRIKNGRNQHQILNIFGRRKWNHRTTATILLQRARLCNGENQRRFHTERLMGSNSNHKLDTISGHYSIHFINFGIKSYICNKFRFDINKMCVLSGFILALVLFRVWARCAFISRRSGCTATTTSTALRAAAWMCASTAWTRSWAWRTRICKFEVEFWILVEKNPSFEWICFDNESFENEADFFLKHLN